MIDRPQRTRHPAQRSPSERALPHEVDPDSGPGWYASTWDLQQGLEVSEGLPADAAPGEALMAYLLSQQPADPAVPLPQLNAVGPIGASASPDAAAPLNRHRRRLQVP